jgi:hypothetical protein
MFQSSPLPTSLFTDNSQLRLPVPHLHLPHFTTPSPRFLNQHQTEEPPPIPSASLTSLPPSKKPLLLLTPLRILFRDSFPPSPSSTNFIRYHQTSNTGNPSSKKEEKKKHDRPHDIIRLLVSKNKTQTTISKRSVVVAINMTKKQNRVILTRHLNNNMKIG